MGGANAASDRAGVCFGLPQQPTRFGIDGVHVRADIGEKSSIARRVAAGLPPHGNGAPDVRGGFERPISTAAFRVQGVDFAGRPANENPSADDRWLRVHAGDKRQRECPFKLQLGNIGSR